MSAIIRTGWMKYKNPITGEYQSIDAITDATTAERVAAVESAIDAKASAAIESIPADYTELSEEVDSLLAGALALSSSLVESLPSNTDFDTLTTAGSYRIATNAAAASMDNCPSTSAGRLIILQSSSSARLFQYYITNGNSCRIYVRWYGADEVWFEWKYLATSDEIMDIQNHLFSEIPFTNDGTGFVNYSTGNVSTSETYDHTNYIDVSQCTSLMYKRAKSTSDNSSVSMCFYNASKQFISAEKCLVGQEELGYADAFKTVIVPEDAVYARFSIYRDTTTYGDFELDGKLRTPYVDSALSSTSKNPVQNKVVKADLDELNNSRKYAMPFSIKETSKYINYSTGEAGSGQNYDYTDYVDVSMCSSVIYRWAKTTVPSTSVGLAFYDSTKTFIQNSGEQIKDKQTDVGYAELKQIEVPSSAVYVRFSTLHDTTTYGDFELYGLYKTPVVDSALSSTSKNPVQNKVVKAGFEKIQVQQWITPGGGGYGFTTIDATGNDAPICFPDLDTNTGLIKYWVLPEATTNNRGAMSAEDKVKLNGLHQIGYVDDASARSAILLSNNGNYTITPPSLPTGAILTSVAILSYTSSAAPFTIMPYGENGTAAIIIGSANTAVNGLKLRFWYMV